MERKSSELFTALTAIWLLIGIVCLFTLITLTWLGNWFSGLFCALFVFFIVSAIAPPVLVFLSRYDDNYDPNEAKKAIFICVVSIVLLIMTASLSDICFFFQNF